MKEVSANGGPVTTLASGLDGPTEIVADGESVYWIGGPVLLPQSPPAGTVMRIPMGGGQPTTIASGQDGASGIAVVGGRVFWSNLGTNPGGGAIVTLDGASTANLATGQPGPASIAADSQGVYWINRGCPGDTANASCLADGSVVALTSM